MTPPVSSVTCLPDFDSFASLEETAQQCPEELLDVREIVVAGFTYTVERSGKVTEHSPSRWWRRVLDLVFGDAEKQDREDNVEASLLSARSNYNDVQSVDDVVTAALNQIPIAGYDEPALLAQQNKGPFQDTFHTMESALARATLQEAHNDLTATRKAFVAVQDEATAITTDPLAENRTAIGLATHWLRIVSEALAMARKAFCEARSAALVVLVAGESRQKVENAERVLAQSAANVKHARVKAEMAANAVEELLFDSSSSDDWTKL